jgi:hypothetical protein
MSSEYEFASMKGGVGGKYVARLRKGSNLVLLEPEVAAAFPSDEAVNEALRGVLNTTRAVRGKGGLPNSALQPTSRATFRELVRSASLLIFAALVLSPAAATSADELSAAQWSSLPGWVKDAVTKGEPGSRYAVCLCLNPFYQRGDFDGDGTADYAVLVADRRDGKRGILIVHRRDRSVHVIGAGRSLGAGGDDFKWMDAWRVVDRGRGKGEGLLVEKTEAASGLIWWDDKGYRWSQRGD